MNSRALALIMVLGLLLPGHGLAEVYKWVDEDGNVHFGDRPPDTQEHQTIGVKSAAASSNGSSLIEGATWTAGDAVGSDDVKSTCDRAARNFKRFLPQLERLAMEGAKGQATDAELKELKKNFVEMRKVSTTEFSQECVTEYDEDPQAKAMADCFGNSADVLSASMCMAFSGSF